MGDTPYILALDTATPVGSVALFSGPKLLGLMETHMDRTHARLITPMVQSLLKKVGLAPSQLDAIGVSSGPGSYTGLRVGVSTAKGLCMALDKPLLSLGSLESLARKVQEVAQQLDAWICPMIDARRMEVFCACYTSDIQSVRQTQAMVVEADSFSELLSENKIIFLGSGAAKCASLLADHPNSIFLQEEFASASSMGKALFEKFQAEAFEDLVRFEPFYLKDFVATKPKNKLKA